MIIGITGTIGAGKGTVVEYLQEKGFIHLSARDIIFAEIRRRGIEVEDRNATSQVGNDLRMQHGPAYVIEQLYARAEERGVPAIVESVRTLGEAEFLKMKGVFLLAVDADRKLRYERIVARGLSTDHVDFATWIMQEERELASTEPWDMNVIGVMQMADYRIENDGSLEELHQKVDAMLETMGR